MPFIIPNAPPLPETRGVVVEGNVGIIPRSAYGFWLADYGPVEGAPADTAYHFTDSARTRVSVFRYAIPPDVRVGNDSTEWINREAAKFPIVLGILKDRGVIDSFTVTLAKPGTSRYGNTQLAQHVTAVRSYSRRGAMIDVQYLWVVDGKFLKLRGTEPERIEGVSPVGQFSLRFIARVLRNVQAPQ